MRGIKRLTLCTRNMLQAAHASILYLYMFSLPNNDAPCASSLSITCASSQVPRRSCRLSHTRPQQTQTQLLISDIPLGPRACLCTRLRQAPWEHLPSALLARSGTSGRRLSQQAPQAHGHAVELSICQSGPPEHAKALAAGPTCAQQRLWPRPGSNVHHLVT